MRNLIMAIIAVGFLQVSFQVYMAFDRSYSQFRSMNEISDVPVKGTPLAKLSEITVDTAFPVHPLKRIETVYRKPEIPIGFARRKVLVKDSVSGTFAVSKPKESGPASKSKGLSPSTVAKTEEQPRQQTSLIGKVLPVIKKPYIWLKTLAIRLK